MLRLRPWLTALGLATLVAAGMPWRTLRAEHAGGAGCCANRAADACCPPVQESCCKSEPPEGPRVAPGCTCDHDRDAALVVTPGWALEGSAERCPPARATGEASLTLERLASRTLLPELPPPRS